MKGFLVVLLATLFISCGKEEVKTVGYISGPSNCEMVQVEEGLVWKCVDHEGNETTGLVKHGLDGEKGPKGETGPAGEQGKDGRDGVPGEGLVVQKQHFCSGEVEGWLENTSYRLAINVYEFETGDLFVSYKNDMLRNGESVNHRDASPFFRSTDTVIKWEDAVFKLDFLGDHVLAIQKSNEVETKIECEEV